LQAKYGGEEASATESAPSSESTNGEEAPIRSQAP
jgi:hypothetical protein